jgi:hypothetical protein
MDRSKKTGALRNGPATRDQIDEANAEESVGGRRRRFLFGPALPCCNHHRHCIVSVLRDFSLVCGLIVLKDAKEPLMIAAVEPLAVRCKDLLGLGQMVDSFHWERRHES